MKQLSVFLENRSGQLSEITALLAGNRVDLRAINIAETADYGVLRFIADDPEKAHCILKEAGMIVSVNEVYALAVPDEVGGLNKLLQLFAAGGVDVKYMYSVFGNQNGLAFMVFQVAEEAALFDVIARNGLTLAKEL